MTEEQWLTTVMPLELIDFVNATKEYRRLRLLGCAMVRLVWPDPQVKEAWDAIEASESFADRLISTWSLRSVHLRCREVYYAASFRNAGNTDSLNLLHRAMWVSDRRPRAALAQATPTLAIARDGPASEIAIRCRTVTRDIFGNPFRPVAFDPAWRTSTGVTLARAMYESRDFAAMPVLADALEEAGCDHADILAHCRDPNGVHVRGCWVVDGLLGKA